MPSGWFALRSLRVRVPLTLLLLFLIFALIFMRLLGVVVLRGYEQLERENVQLDVLRSVAGLDALSGQLESAVGDWAPWDDTYEFMLDYSRDYIDENLTPATLDNLGVDYAAFVDTTGRVGYAQYIDRESGQRLPPSAEMTGAAMRAASLLKPSRLGESLTGTLMLPEGPALIAVQQITNNEADEPSRGSLVFIRLLSADDLERVRAAVRLNVELTPAQDRGRLTFASAVPAEKRDEPYSHVIDDERIAGWATRTGFDGQPSFIVSVVEGRSGRVHAVRALEFSGWGILSFIVFFGVGMSLTLDMTVLRRLTRLHDQVVAIESDPDAPKRVDELGNDELTDFAVTLNRALARVEETEKALTHAADHDYLTGLPNRRRFEQEADRELAERKREGGECAVALIDVDEFKEINDGHGHHCGDEVLVWLSALMRSSVRSYCTVARLGGDEFAILMPHTARDQAEKVLERLQTRLEHTPCPCSMEHIWVRVSVGLASSPLDGETLEELTTVADRRLYQSKAGKCEQHPAEPDDGDWPG